MQKTYTSPNYNTRPEGAVIDTLVLHYTGMESAEAALERLCDAEAQVSAHYVVEEDGTIHQLVDEQRRAWHAGKSIWCGRQDINDVSIGIELVNPGHEFGYREFPEAQIAALIPLCQEILSRHPIPARNVVSHSDIAPSRKEDPGELFDWKRLAEAGVGIWVDNAVDNPINLLQEGDEGEHVKALQERLAQYGYGIVPDGHFGLQTTFVAKAFQRHFGATTDITGLWDTLLDARLEALLAIVNA